MTATSAESEHVEDANRISADRPQTLSTTFAALEEDGAESRKEISLWRKIYNVLTWTPPNCRWDPAKPPQFSMSMSMFDLKNPPHLC